MREACQLQHTLCSANKSRTNYCVSHTIRAGATQNPMFPAQP